MGTAASRYRIERLLGRGGMGAVFLARDEELDRRVALKRAHRSHAADLLRFKREWRALEGLSHPNLVRVYELGVDDEGLFFTMEAIEGVDLRRHCDAPDRRARLEAALPQMVAALAFLHAHGVAHCDLKPENVLVDAAGVVKLVDFGVLAEIAGESPEPGVAGTAAYLAPERARGEPASAASDVYALGCTIYELLAGRPPFVGAPRAVLDAHATQTPAPPRALAPDAPAHLEALCLEMLAKDPAARPSLAAIGARLRSGELPGAPARPGTSRALLGREALLAQIESHLRPDASATPRLVVLAGPSGVGKSALLGEIARRAASAGRVVLRSASRPSERLAYNAVDAAVDDLARVLRSGDAAGAIEPRAIRIAAQAFPVLRAGSGHADAAREEVRMRLFGFRDRLDTRDRREVFEALARVLDGAAGARGLVLVADDVQWADADSVSALRHVVARASHRVAVVLALRDDVEPGLAHAWLAGEPSATRVEVPALSLADTAAIVRHVAAALGAVRVAPDAVEAAARACEGRPFLAEVAGRALARGAGGAAADPFADAWATDPDLLGVLVVEDGWTPARALAAVLARAPGEVEEALARLAHDGVVRRAGAGLEARADLYHDRVRAALAARVDGAMRARTHARLADYHLAHGAPGPRVVRHLAGAGRRAEAALHARAAAEVATRQRAFGLAADMLAVALAEAPRDEALREARAWALDRSGRYAEAAREWATLAQTARGDRALDLALHEAHASIAASEVAHWVRRLEGALAREGGGGVRVAALERVATVARFLAGPLPWPRARAHDAATRRRAERHLKLGILLAFLDPLTGMRFLLGARADFRRAGAAAQVAGCDYVLAILALAGSRRAGRVPLAERYRAAADAHARALELPPDVRGLRPCVLGIAAMREARWRDADALLAKAIGAFEHASGTTEITMARAFQMMSAAHAQDLPAMRRHLEAFHRHTADRGASFLVVHHALVEGYRHFLEGRFADGFETLTRAADRFDDEPPNAQRAALLVYRWATRLYDPDAARTRREVAAAFHRARGFGFLRTMYVQAYGIVGALAEANALREGDPDARYERVARLADRMDASPPLSAGVSWRARAYAEDARGRPEQALACLVRAEHDAARHDRPIDVAIARWQRGRRLGGDGGRALCDAARAAVEAVGASPRLLEEDAGLR